MYIYVYIHIYRAMQFITERIMRRRGKGFAAEVGIGGVECQGNTEESLMSSRG
jgi:hypothetical protein